MESITFPALQSINDQVSMEFNTQLGAVVSKYRRFTQDTNSTGKATTYPRVNMLPGLRRWTGDRVVNSLSMVTFEINNELFESTIGVERSNLEDDQYGFLTGAAAGLGLSAGRLPDLLIAALMNVGHTTPCYDGQNFFDTAHPDFTSNGGNTTSPNYVTGSSTPWYLFDVSNYQKALVFQRRRPFVLIPKFSMTDPQVFWSKEFEWGIDGRCNAGFGIWQYGFKSLQTLTMENLVSARTQMATYRRPDGSPMGVQGTLLVVPTSLFTTAKALAEDALIPNTYTNAFTASGTVTQVPNVARGLFEAYEDQWLN